MDALRVPPVPGVVSEKIKAVKPAMSKMFNKCEDKRMAPSSMRGTVNVLHVAWLPEACGNYLIGALPSGVICLMHAVHLHKTYFFYDDVPKLPNTTSNAIGKEAHADKSAGGAAPSDRKADASPSTSDDAVDEKEAERRRNLNTCAVRVLEPGPSNTKRCLLMVSILDMHFIAYMVPIDLSTKSLQLRRDHYKLCKVPEGSWKRAWAAFNVSGDRLFVGLRPSTVSSSVGSKLGILVCRVPNDWRTMALHGEWLDGPADLAAHQWLDDRNLLLLDRFGGVLFVLRCGGDERGIRPSASPAPARLSCLPPALPILHYSVQAACFSKPTASVSAPAARGALVPPPVRATQPDHCTLFVALDVNIIQTFELTWTVIASNNSSNPTKRGRDGDAVDVFGGFQLTVVPGRSCVPGDFRIQALSWSVASDTPILLVGLETGAILVVHPVTLDVLHHHPYARKVKDGAATRLLLCPRERANQLGVVEGEWIAMMRSS